MSAPSQIGPYVVEREIGRGGMGVVFLARDPRLDRRAAIKALPGEFAQDPERLARFEREARLLASLTHPNIAAVYGLEEKDGARHLVMEFVEGRTLAEVLAQGPLPVDEALQVAVQIASALEAAHEAGVIHRDLKPGNVIVTPAGKAKVLDFGLAKSVAPGAASSSSMVNTASIAHRATVRATGAGNVVGTPGYLSPEQARGKPLDKRTDVWAFGCVLFECLAGKQLYSGETVSDVIAAILEREPDWSKLPERTPGRVRELLSMCLEKEQGKRLRDMGDVRLELERAIAGREWSSSSLSMRAAPAARGRRGSLWRGAAVLLVGAALGAGLWAAAGGRWGVPSAPEPRMVRSTLQLPEKTAPGAFALTPDGKAVIARVNDRTASGEPLPRLYVRPLDSFEARPIPGTDGATGTWGISPDGRWLRFMLEPPQGGGRRVLMRVPIDGSGPASRVTEFGPQDPAGGITWLEGGELLLQKGPKGPFVRLSVEGEARGAEWKASGDAEFDSLSAAWPLPGGRLVLVELFRYAAKGWTTDIGVMSLGDGRVRRLTEGARPVWTSSGHLVFARGERLMGVAFDPEKGEVVGSPVALIDGLQSQELWTPGWFDVSSQNGTLAYVAGGVRTSQRRLGIMDASGKVEPLGDETRSFLEGRLSTSRDGKRLIAGASRADGLFEILACEVERPLLRVLVTSRNSDMDQGRLSPDGRSVAFLSISAGLQGVLKVTPWDGVGEAVQLAEFDFSEFEFENPAGWSPDGKELVVVKGRKQAPQGVFVRPVSDGSGGGQPRPLLTGAANFGSPEVSSDGRVLAYLSDETGRNEAYVRTIGADWALGPPVRVSTQGVGWVGWRDGSKSLWLQEIGGRRMFTAEVLLEPELSAGKLVEAFDWEEKAIASFTPLGGTVGRAVVVMKSPLERESGRVNLVLNWFEELKAKAPRGGGGEAKP